MFYQPKLVNCNKIVAKPCLESDDSDNVVSFWHSVTSILVIKSVSRSLEQHWAEAIQLR